MSRKCLECEAEVKTEKLHIDHRFPPLNVVPCLCLWCSRDSIIEAIDEHQRDIDELNDKLAITIGQIRQVDKREQGITTAHIRAYRSVHACGVEQAKKELLAYHKALLSLNNGTQDYHKETK